LSLPHHTSLPTSPDEITAVWLTEALALQVDTATVADVISGGATKVRLRLTGPAAPASVIVKAPLSGAAQNADTLSFFAGEVAFYRDVSSLLDVGSPRCLYAETRLDEGQAIVILEDLTGARFFAAGDTLDTAEAHQFLDALARLHATTWGHPLLDGPAPFPGAMRPVLTAMLSGRYWDGCLARPRSAPIPPPLRQRGAMRAAIEELWRADAERSQCFVHGDAHVGNGYVTPAGPVGCLDWQMSGPGDPCHDVAYFIASALAPAERRAVEGDLLRAYLDSLVAYGGPTLTLDHIWMSYRQHMIHGLFWATNADGMYPEDINLCMVERFSRAISELDALGALNE
jgi:aminoglycoside/choline kinase family phosphotransferase